MIESKYYHFANPEILSIGKEQMDKLITIYYLAEVLNTVYAGFMWKKKIYLNQTKPPTLE